MNPLIKKPSAWIPLALSLLAIAGILAYATIVGNVSTPGGDEGTPARIFQLSLVVQAVVILIFAIKWLPQLPRQAFVVLLFQILGICVAVGLIVYLEARVTGPMPDIEVSEPTNFNRVGVVTLGNPGQEVGTPFFIYEEPGKPALSVTLAFDTLSVCAAPGGAIPCVAMSAPFEMSYGGKTALVEGTRAGDTVLVRKVRAANEGEELRAFEPGNVFISWYHATELLKNCQVKGVMQTHALDVYLDLKDGRRVRAVEPQIDDIFHIIDQTRGACGSFPVATE